MGATLTSPCRPCARPIRPTSSRTGSFGLIPAPSLEGVPSARPARSFPTGRLLRDVDGDAHAFGRAGGAGNLTHGLDHATALADDATEVAGAGVNQQRDGVAAFVGVDEHTLGVV